MVWWLHKESGTPSYIEKLTNLAIFYAKAQSRTRARFMQRRKDRNCVFRILMCRKS